MNIATNIKQELENVLKKLNIEVQVPFVVEIPKDNTNGDYATNIAMQLTKILKQNPRNIANRVVELFSKDACNVEKIEIAGPGFINFFVKSTSFASLIKHVINANDNFGKQDYGKGKKYDVEFVSANPTGDLHLGHAWQAALVDNEQKLIEINLEFVLQHHLHNILE